MLCFIFLLFNLAQPVLAQGWDDFTNNLATDLAPFLSLFGEQITKQYLSESLTPLDYFIFAMAPIGILTAIVSAIRVCGSSSMRAFIGRAQEGAGAAEAELCSSTSRDICELYNNGGVARVFGRPKILEIVHDTSEQDPGKWEPRIYTFLQYAHHTKGQADWTESSRTWYKGFSLSKSTESESGCTTSPEPEHFAPNLSLNIGIRRLGLPVYWAVAVLGFILQSGVLVFATVVTYYLRWKQDDKVPDTYACPLTVVGTVLVCSGSFYCAALIGHSTQERVFRRNPSSKPTTMYWLQPGGQVIGDQTFDAFAYTDSKGRLEEYAISGKNRKPSSETHVWAAVAITIVGFILQFTGLRALHAAVSLVQLGATLLMSVARAALRMQRIKPNDNLLYRRPDQILGHELDWLAIQLEQPDQYDVGRDMLAGSTSLWRFRGMPRVENRIRSEPCVSYRDSSAYRILAYRACLADITKTLGNQAKSAPLVRSFGLEMVEGREKTTQLSRAIESVINMVYSKTGRLGSDWKDSTNLHWGLDIEFNRWDTSKWDIKTKTALIPFRSRNGLISSLSTARDTIPVELKRQPGGHWKLTNRLMLEGVLGLWLWSLKSDYMVEASDQLNDFKISRAADIPSERIVATSQEELASFEIWLSDKLAYAAERKSLSHADHNAATIWEWVSEYDSESAFTEDSGTVAISPGYRPLGWLFKQGIFDEASCRVFRLFGWPVARDSAQESRERFRDFGIFSVPVHDSLLSLCSQEIFACFFASILEVIDDFGSTQIREETHHFHLQNELLSEVTSIFVEEGLGRREEAFMCILPLLLRRLPSPSTEQALNAATKSANENRKNNEWSNAQSVLKWAWGICLQSLAFREGNSNSGNELIEGAATAIGELYRWALAGQEEKQQRFGSMGIQWLREQVPSTPCPIDHIVNRYEAIQKWTQDQQSTNEVDSLDNRTKVLCRLTQRDPLTHEEKGELLHLAAEGGWPEAVIASLELGVDPNFEDITFLDEPAPILRRYETALSKASKLGHVAVVKELIEGGAFPHVADNYQRTPLSHAAEAGHIEVMNVLIKDRRVVVNAKDNEGRTPLYWASAKGHFDAVHLLIKDARADPNTSTNEDLTPIFEAAANGDEKTMELLLRTSGIKANARGVDEHTALGKAASMGNEKIVKLLLDSKLVDVNLPLYSQPCHTPLWTAAWEGHAGVIKLLLETDGIILEDPKNCDEYDRETGTALHAAAYKGHEQVVRLLLGTQKMNPHLRRKDGQTALTLAIRSSQESVAKLIMDAGKADLDSYEEGELGVAAVESGDVEILKWLLGIGQTVKEPEFLRFTGYNEGGPSTLLGRAIQYNREHMAKSLLSMGIVEPRGLDTYTFVGRTDYSVPHLQGVVGEERTWAIKLLLDTGKIDVNMKVRRMGADGKRQTLLAWASHLGVKESTLKLLESYGAKMELQ